MRRPKRRGRRALLLLVLCALGVFSLWGVWRGLCGGAGLCGWDAIQHVEIRGTTRVDADQVKAWAAVPLRRPLVTFEAGGVVARLEGRPWIKGVVVTKRFPDTVVITVTERVPTAVAVMDRGRVLVDADGQIIGPAVQAKGYPMIVGASTSRPVRLETAARILAAFQLAEVSVSRLDELVIDVTNPDDPLVDLPGSVRVRMGRGAFTEKWRRVEAIHASAATKVPSPRVVDLRFADRAVVTAWSGAL